MATAAAERVSHRPTANLSTLFTSEEGQNLCVPAAAHTLAGFRRWIQSDAVPEKLRALYLHGEVCIDISKENLEHHYKVKMEIARSLLNLNRVDKLGSYYGDGARVTNAAAEVSNNPDGVFISKASFQSKRARLIAGAEDENAYLEIEGAPDMVLEVVSDSSVDKDMRRLRAAYHHASFSRFCAGPKQATSQPRHVRVCCARVFLSTIFVCFAKPMTPGCWNIHWKSGEKLLVAAGLVFGLAIRF